MYTNEEKPFYLFISFVRSFNSFLFLYIFFFLSFFLSFFLYLSLCSKRPYFVYVWFGFDSRATSEQNSQQQAIVDFSLYVSKYHVRKYNNRNTISINEFRQMEKNFFESKESSATFTFYF